MYQFDREVRTLLKTRKPRVTATKLTQKLIASGKIMDGNEKAVRDFRVAENSTIVLMTVKTKPVKPAPEESKQEQSQPVPMAAPATQ